MRKISLNRNQIKYIAIIAMLIDHIAAYLIGSNSFIYYPMRIVGRITAPIMCFFLVEGYKHTHSKLMYAIRLFLLALVAQIPYSLLKSGTIFTFSFNFIFTLFLSFFILLTCEKVENKFIKSILVFSITLMSIACDWTITGPILVLLFYKLGNNKHMSVYYCVTVMMVCLTQILLHITSEWYFGLIKLGMLLALPILKTYDYTSGKKNFFNKWFFYVFYPLHLLIIYIISI